MWFVSEKKYKRLLDRKDDLVEMYGNLKEEKEDLQNLYNNLKIDFNLLNEKYLKLSLAQEEEKKKIRGESYLSQENEKLTDWIRDILRVFGEQQPGNYTTPMKIPYFKYNREFKDVTCGWLFSEEGKAGYIPMEEIIIPELHIVVKGI